MADWRQFQNKQRQKRTAKTGKKGRGESTEAKDEIVVQRMTSEVTGKQQKYSRIGPREFVPFEFDELSFENVVDACQKYFAGQVEKDMLCDILAGERGPSCKKISQIPDLKVFYVRFIKPESSNEDTCNEHDVSHQPKKARKASSSSVPSPQKATHSKPLPKATCSKFYPKSLSLKDMLRLGKVIPKKTSTIISISKFDFHHMLWSNVPIEAEFMVEEEPFACGGFRQAYKATGITDGFRETKWVVKKYLKSALDVIELTKETEESHTRKSVQMHYLARNFASQLKEDVEKQQLTEFGPTFEYKKVFMGKIDGGAFVTIEEFIDGAFVKFINNNGELCEDGELCEKAQAFAHFTYQKSEGKLIVLDIQGAGYTLYDAEMASLDLLGEEGNYQFCTGNLSHTAMNNFF
ncbi:hypothetical protein QZH41_019354 [Actinostola sp. cb2023]|nr:hypothetical protein QZH41_019354 [Actinostola sp. cb2023]